MRQVKADSIVPLVRNLGLFFFAILVIFTAVIAGQFPAAEGPYITALSSKYYYEKGRNLVQGLSQNVGNETLKTLLRAELPVLAASDSGQPAAVQRRKSLLRISLNTLSGVKLDDPLTYLKSEIPMMEVTPATADTYDETGPDEVLEDPGEGQLPAGSSQETEGAAGSALPVENRVKSDTPLIALYNTHTSETFELTDGLAHLKGKAGGIALVTGEIKKAIEEDYGIPVVYSDKLHDTSFNKSYAESEKTVKQLLEGNPGLEMVFDIHRDGAVTREQSLVTIHGQQVARILIIVGTDARADHPHWQENLEFAREIAAKMDAMYPGLSRGITTKEGRYHQQYSPRALLVEIGSAKNATDEAVASGRLFANVVVAVLNDMAQAAEETSE
ncbi:stage II sporulation protein P [Phosphitispora fastidiosa]|uniref:stage II sporulation protein P n=1 Tax=Phosphitispora fastidiosa TaxID=2837202 RepID=UPI001E5151CD|nr:stage II sporulation protein P [Phosphitispora fastidiosa]MBU7005916.1 stage II sporulation protein P [Phosphitispora fastidiosa]